MLPLLFLFLTAAEGPAPHPLDPDAVMQAIRKTLAAQPDYRDANLEIVEVSHFPVPDGQMEFDWKGLTPPATGQVTARWRGIVRQDVDHTFTIWAIVRLTAPCKRLIAAQTIRPDAPIVESDVLVESYEGFPSEACAGGVANVVGKVATRTISANSAIVPSMLAPPAAVLKGEQAMAEYRDESVRLSLPVIAERSGRIGEIIPVRNPASHKLLSAQVVGDGKVLINGDKQ